MTTSFQPAPSLGHPINREALRANSTDAVRRLAGDLTHDLNSALQALGDSLFALRDDTDTLLHRFGAAGTREGAELDVSFQLAAEASDRLVRVARLLPRLTVEQLACVGPIDLEAELNDLIALTWHSWRHAAEITVEVVSPLNDVWCEWWLARFAIQLQLSAAMSRLETPAPGDARARVRVVVSRAAEVIGIRVVAAAAEQGKSVGDAPIDDALRSRIECCAAALNGAFAVVAPYHTELRFPVRSFGIAQ